jgi:elongation factor G
LVVWLSSVPTLVQLDAGSYVLNTRSGKKERISRLYQMHSNKQNPIDKVEAGDIAAAVGFKDLRTGDTICDLNQPDRPGIYDISPSR